VFERRSNQHNDYLLRKNVSYICATFFKPEGSPTVHKTQKPKRPFLTEPFPTEPFLTEPFLTEPFPTEPFLTEPFLTDQSYQNFTLLCEYQVPSKVARTVCNEQMFCIYIYIYIYIYVPQKWTVFRIFLTILMLVLQDVIKATECFHIGLS